MTQYICKKHGEIYAEFSLEEYDEDSWCMSCFVDLLNKFCEKVSVIEDDEDDEEYDKL